MSLAMMVRGDLGLAPWDVLHSGLIRHVPITLGQAVVVMSFVVLILWIPLKEMPGIGTISNALVVGLACDATLWLLDQPGSLALRIALMVGGILLCGLATALYIGAQLGRGPRDGLMTGLTRRTGLSIRLVRTGLEVSVVVIGLLLGGGLGLGTIAFALAIGPITQACSPVFLIDLPVRRSCRSHGETRAHRPDNLRTHTFSCRGGTPMTETPTPPQPPAQEPAPPAGGGAAAEAAPLAPPTETLTLTAPEAPSLVIETQAPKMAPQVAAEQLPELDAKVDTFLTALSSTEANSPEFAAQAENVRTMGDADIRKAAETSNRMLEQPVRALKEGGIAQGSAVGKTLLELRRTVEDLDPSQATGAKRWLDMLPFGDKITDYFRKYQSAQTQLNGILHSLRNGQDELTKDNVALNLEKTNLWATMGRLNQYVYVAERLDAKLAAKIAELELSDPEMAKTLNQDVLFYVRQKHQDLLTQLAVSIQSYLAIDIIIKNNIELIKGVDRASTTTISALRTAVIVAQALGNQKLVLDQITALNTTTSGMIERTSVMLKENSAAIQEQAASSTIGIEQLQAAFANIYATMDSIDEFKLKALDSMSATIGLLETEVQKSQSYLDRVKKHDQRNAAGTLDIA